MGVRSGVRRRAGGGLDSGGGSTGSQEGFRRGSGWGQENRFRKDSEEVMRWSVWAHEGVKCGLTMDLQAQKGFVSYAPKTPDITE